jgi:hypothetical protein
MYNMPFLILLIFFTFSNSFAEIKTYEYKEDSLLSPEIYLRDNVYSTKHIFSTNSQIKNSEIVINKDNNDLNTIFRIQPLEIGDKITFDTNEKRALK